MLYARRHRFLLATPLVSRALADDPAIRRLAAHLNLQDAAVLEGELQNFAVLRDRW